MLKVPPGFIDFTSSSFDAIMYPAVINDDSQLVTPPSSPPDDTIKRRASHLPDLTPFISLITDKCEVEPVHLVMALIYVTRFKKALPAGYKAEPEAAHRIFVASLLIASKYSEDRCLSTKRVVRATGDVWSIKEITRMELAFLRFLNWDLYITQEEMTHFLKDLGFDINLILPIQFILEDTCRIS